MNCIQLLERAAAQWPCRPAITDRDDTWTYAALTDRVARLAGGLRQLGVRPTDPVAVLAAQHRDTLVASLAVAWAGAELVPIDPRGSSDAAVAALRNTAAVGLVVDDANGGRIGELLDRCPYLRVLVHAGRDAAPAEAIPLTTLVTGHDPLPAPDAAEIHALGRFHTDGIGGRPRPVPLRHQDFVVAALSLLAEGGLPNTPILSTTEPLSNATVMTAAMAVMMRAGCLVMPEAGEWECAHGPAAVTDLLTTPAWLRAYPGQAADDAGHLPDRILLAGDLADDTLVGRTLAVLPGVSLRPLYGNAETAGFISLGPRLTAEPRESTTPVGGAAPHVDIRVRDQANLDCPSGQIGSILARGPGGADWLDTGDIGHFDDSGRLHLAGRAGDVLMRNDDPVYLRAIEMRLAMHSDVADAAVIAHRGGIRAWVVPAAGAGFDAESLRTFCCDGLPVSHHPNEIFPLPVLSRTAAGRIRKHLLRTGPASPDNEQAPPAGGEPS
ncbi:class I adenylate-forming enzyme family protein [Spectribacter hydrogenoxidans]|uniref:Class I adenylate-forming enzyme family protein n=1 Tax=Spectribacter hydrogenoxidans TaxID=3075608 RepID=A0ABU3C2A1_9GAMM|nr:class I adenylate-forming enzyme family protein [Salinisphaera sp. W335]MDT0635683.1 class I adenylate-forming enzyme family protein [Salinisphaera sp. W335]